LYFLTPGYHVSQKLPDNIINLHQASLVKESATKADLQEIGQAVWEDATSIPLIESGMGYCVNPNVVIHDHNYHLDSYNRTFEGWNVWIERK
jgi:hypothetical protein